MNFLTKTIGALNIYYTPRIIENMLTINYAIGNPPFMNEEYYIKYFDNEIQKVLNVNFKCFESAMEWGQKNINNFNDEMINKII